MNEISKVKFLKKRYIAICLFIPICLLILFSVYIYNNKKDFNVKEIKLSDNMTKNKSYDSLVITDIKAKRVNEVNQIMFTVKNNTDSDYKYKNTNIYFLDGNNNTIQKINIAIPNIKKNEEGSVATIVDKQTLKSEDFKIKD